MTSLKTVTQLTTMLFTLALSNVLFAGESVKNAHKDNGAGDTISNADAVSHVDGDIFSAVEAKVSYQQKMQQRHREMQEAQRTIFKRYLQEHGQLSAAYNRAQQKAFLTLIEERRTLMKKMMDKHRQAAEQRRKTMLLKMHQTSITPELAQSLV